MDLGQYLRDLLGASGAEALKRALAEGRTVIVTGVYGSGKSTLAARCGISECQSSKERMRIIT